MSVSTQENTSFNYITTFGEEFEKYGGLRILSIAETMHDEEPVDDWGYYIDSCNRYLTEEQTLAGCEKDEDLYPLIEACYDLRMAYGHEVWIGAALLVYLRDVKGLTDAEAIRDRMVADAKAQFAPLVEQYLHESRVAYIESLKNYIPVLERALQQHKEDVARLEQELAQAA